jgi:hypothetical protein
MTPLPAQFLRALEGQDELVVSSREGSTERSVHVWFVLAPPGVLYLFGDPFSYRARRWRADPWVRVRVPGGEATLESRVQFVRADELTPELVDAVVERWGMWGAVTPEGLRRMVADGAIALVRVEGSSASPG